MTMQDVEAAILDRDAWEEEANAQREINLKLRREIASLRREIAHLKHPKLEI